MVYQVLSQQPDDKVDIYTTSLQNAQRKKKELPMMDQFMR